MHSNSVGNAAIGPVVVFVAIGLVILTVGAVYVGLCAYFALRADRLAPAAAPVAPATEAHDAVSMPFNWLVPAVVAIVLGFTPCAVASLVHASRVAIQHRAGCVEEARESARLARVWFWWSVAIGVALLAMFSALPWLARLAATMVR
jgi:hypothetical protein